MLDESLSSSLLLLSILLHDRFVPTMINKGTNLLRELTPCFVLEGCIPQYITRHCTSSSNSTRSCCVTLGFVALLSCCSCCLPSNPTRNSYQNSTDQTEKVSPSALIIRLFTTRFFRALFIRLANSNQLDHST